VAIAFFSTWTTYGARLPGDDRGWFQKGRGWQEPDRMLAFEATLRMTDEAITLNLNQRRLVEAVVSEHCAIRGWVLHAVNCRSNHVHVVVTAYAQPIELPREQFKAWSTRRLKDLEMTRRMATQPSVLVRNKWWTDRGWDEYIDDEDELAAVKLYVLEGQDAPR
jgi:REP element-mobilizing transposase RayT